MVVDHDIADLMVGLLMKTWQFGVFFSRLSLATVSLRGPEPDLRLLTIRLRKLGAARCCLLGQG